MTRNSLSPALSALLGLVYPIPEDESAEFFEPTRRGRNRNCPPLRQDGREAGIDAARRH